jgi:hypothetical protein
MPDTIHAAANGFAELVYADPDWVRAEFDAIVAANFRPVPPTARPGATGPRRPVRRVVREPRSRRPVTPVPPAHCLRRQRAPPNQQPFPQKN